MGLKDVWLDFREACLTSPRFHDIAIRFPFTRPVVRKRQSELFDVVSGFVYSQVLAVVVETGVLDRVKGAGLRLAPLAQAIGLGVDETRRLADAAVSLRLLERSGPRYRLGDLGSALSINPGVLAMIRHHNAFYRDLADPLDLLRGGRRETNLSRLWDYALSDRPQAANDGDVAAYSTLMSESQAMVAEEIVASYPFVDHEVLLDVGGGQGTFLSHVGKANPHLRLQLFDLPAVAARAQTALDKAGLGERSQTFGGSFFDDPLPKGADLVSLVRIIHDHDDEQAMAILRAVHECLPERGTLIVCEPMSTGGSAHRISDAYFNFYLYAMGSGRPRSPQMICQMLEEAGFSTPRPMRTRAPLIASIVRAQKS